MTTTWQIFRVLPIIHLSGQQKKNFKVIFLSFTHWWVKVFYLCRAV